MTRRTTWSAWTSAPKESKQSTVAPLARAGDPGYGIGVQTKTTDTLAQLILDGQATELDYMTTDQLAENLDRIEFLRSRDSDELADAADFIALVVGSGTNERRRSD